MKVAGLIAAAGTSTRMRQCKALLPFAVDISFVQRMAEVFVASGLDPVVITMPEDDHDCAVIEQLLEHLPVVTTKNERPEDGLSGSVITALLHANDAEALLISPVDCPFVDVSIVQALLIALRVSVAAVPAVAGVRGHPVAFSRPAFDLLWTCANKGGPRAVLDALAQDVFDVPWSDPRVCDDVDTPDDYERLFGRKVPSSARR